MSQFPGKGKGNLKLDSQISGRKREEFIPDLGERKFDAGIPGNEGKREGELYKNSKFNSRFYLNRQENWFVLFLFVQCLLKIHVFWPALF